MKKKGNKLFYIILVVMFVLGLLITAYPFVSNFINEMTNKSHIDEYDNEVAVMDSKTKSDILSKAKAYNDIIGTEYYLDNGKFSKEYQAVSKSYDEIMNFDNSLIGYIEIPKISVKLPIYHETKPYALTMGAIHTKRSSFPIGGKGTHSVISAHSAYPSQKFFDNIDELENGDEFKIKILDETLNYKVVEINIVKPDDSSKLKVQQDKDLVTLCTCYPYSVNTHRLLVTGERTAIKENIRRTDKSSNKQSESNLEAYIIAGFIIISGFVVFYIIRRKAVYENQKEKQNP